MTTITFDFDEIKEFIDGIEEVEYDRCGHSYSIRFRLSEDGKIQMREWDWHKQDEEWEDLDIKGVIDD